MGRFGSASALAVGVLGLLGVLWPGVAFGAVETPVTLAASGVGGHGALLHGELNPGAAGEPGEFEFTYLQSGSECAGEAQGVVPEASERSASGVKEEAVSAAVSGLEPGRVYSFCVVAIHEGEVVSGGVRSFTTSLVAPEVVAKGGVVSQLTPFDGTLEAQVDPENLVATYRIEFANNKAMTGARTLEESSLPAGYGNQTVGPVDIGGGLSPDTTYYYRVTASNKAGTTVGAVEEFTTAALAAPGVGEEAAAVSGQSTVSLAGGVNPEFQPVTACGFLFVEERVFLESGFTDATPAACSPSAGELGEGGGPVPVSAPLTGLAANTAYEWQLDATNATGPTEGAPRTFLTFPNPPSVTTRAASGLTPTSATLSGLVDPGATGYPEQDETTYMFQYGHTTSYGSELPSPATNVGEGASAKEETTSLTGLEPGSSYHYRIIATNNNANIEGGPAQTTYGQDETFTTTSTPPTLANVGISSTQTTATITATIEPDGLPTRYELEAGPTPGLLAPQASGNTTTTTPITITLGNLTPGSVYYYKLTATNENGTATTPETPFTTSPPTPAAAAPGLPALIPYTPIAVLDAKEAKENPPIKTPPTHLTNKQKLTKALQHCRKLKNHHTRTTCEQHAHHKYPTKHKK